MACCSAVCREGYAAPGLVHRLDFALSSPRFASSFLRPAALLFSPFLALAILFPSLFLVYFSVSHFLFLLSPPIYFFDPVFFIRFLSLTCLSLFPFIFPPFLASAILFFFLFLVYFSVSLFLFLFSPVFVSYRVFFMRFFFDMPLSLFTFRPFLDLVILFFS